MKLIVLASDPTSETVLEALRSHAFSYFHDMSNPTALGDMLRHALEEPAWDDGIEVISARPEWISLRIRCKMLTVERLLQFMRELRTDLPEPERESLGTACREMLLNAVEHGGGFDADQAVEVHRVKTARFVLYAIRDPGEGFSFDALPQAAVSNPDDPPLQHAEYRERHGLRPGGLGLLVSRGLVDELIHSAATKCC